MVEEVKNLEGHLQVFNNQINFNWKIVGFNEIPFWERQKYPVTSSAFALNGKSDSVWQMWMVKELRCKKNCICSVCKVSDKNEDSEIQTDSTIEDFEIISGHPSLESKTKLKGRDRALGFQIIKRLDGIISWVVIKYYIQLTIGDIKKTTEQRTQIGLCDKKYTYLYLYESDFEGLDLDDVETIQVEAFIEYTSLDPNPLEPAVPDVKKISKDIYQLFETQEHSDVLLKAGDVEIPAHKAFLCARSFTLDCILQGDATRLEKLSLDLDKNVAEALLSFIYCGGIPSEFPLMKCKALCAAADKYKVDGLKAVVNKFFKKNLDLEICFQCLSLDDSDFNLMTIPEDKLKSVLLKEMCDHKSEIEAK